MYIAIINHLADNQKQKMLSGLIKPLLADGYNDYDDHDYDDRYDGDGDTITIC